VLREHIILARSEEELFVSSSKRGNCIRSVYRTAITRGVQAMLKDDADAIVDETIEPTCAEECGLEEDCG
jgi:hypothetical protein